MTSSTVPLNPLKGPSVIFTASSFRSCLISFFFLYLHYIVFIHNSICKSTLLKRKIEIELTFTEFEIFILLAESPGRVFSKESIYDKVWKEPYLGDYNIVMSHIRNIRKKIEDNPSKPIYIQTVWGVGYRFNKNLSSGL